MLDRELQKKLLDELKGNYPSEELHYEFNWLDSKNPISVNLHYLADHGLVRIQKREWQKVGENGFAPVHGPAKGTAKITHAGMDFLADDGGLTAVLGTVTVRLHADTIRDLIDAKIVESNAIPEQEKPALREALKGMKEEGLKQLTTRLITYGLDQGSITAQQLGQWLSS